ncbi:MAG TPA: phosphatase PAP2 family protein [Fibrobacteria bacterium]|nr:phosphatase PAP2 family protein [Fibrobacteria bacterium]
MHLKPAFFLLFASLPILCPAASPETPSLSLATPPAFAPQPYGFNALLDIPLAGGLLAMKFHSGSLLKQTRNDLMDPAALDSRDVPGYDRWAIGFHSSTLSAVSSGLAWSQFLFPMALDAWDVHQGRQPWHGALTDALILEEALMLSTSLSSYAKSFRIHSTPLSYDPGVDDGEKRLPQNASSFFSNHTATAFTTAVFSGYTFQLRHPESRLVPWVWGASLTLATGVGALRIMAGKHFPSDVAAGAAVGALCGYLVPRLHLGLVASGAPMRAPGMRSPTPAEAEKARSLPEKKRYDVKLGLSFPGGSTTPVPTVNVDF